VDAEGQVQLSTRISGPVHSGIERLSFRVILLDAEQRPLQQAWQVVDLTTIPRGGPRDLTFRIDAGGASDAIHGLQLDPVERPTAEEELHIVELAAVRGS
jgi:hypothetical protein